MQRWNGWGDDSIHMELPRKGRELLNEWIGEGRPLRDGPVEKLHPSPKPHLHRIRDLCKNALDWDDSRWDLETQIYLDQWNHFHALPQSDPDVVMRDSGRTNTFQSTGKAL